MRILALAAMAVVISTFSTSLCRADSVFTFSGGQGQEGQNATYGFQFTPVVNITVDSLGFIDAGQNGLLGGHQVGIWNGSGTLLTSATVTTADSTLGGPVVAGSQFRYTSITAIQLLAGVTYTFGAAENSTADEWYAGATNISNSPSLVSVSSNGFFVLNGFQDPTNSIGNTYAVGDFTAEATSAAPVVPEPSSVTLLGTGLAAAVLLLQARRRRMAHS